MCVYLRCFCFFSVLYYFLNSFVPTYAQTNMVWSILRKLCSKVGMKSTKQLLVNLYSCIFEDVSPVKWLFFLDNFHTFAFKSFTNVNIYKYSVYIFFCSKCTSINLCLHIFVFTVIARLSKYYELFYIFFRLIFLYDCYFETGIIFVVAINSALLMSDRAVLIKKHKVYKHYCCCLI